MLHMCSIAFTIISGEVYWAHTELVRGVMSPMGGGQLKFSVQWSAPMLLAGCVKHIKRLPARLANDQVSSITCATNQPLIPSPFFSLCPSVPLSLSWHLSHPLSLLLLFPLFLPILLYYIFSSLMRCGRIPITKLSDRNTAQDSGHRIFMWNETHNINYSFLSAHTNTCPLVCSMDVHMQMRAWPHNIAVRVLLPHSSTLSSSFLPSCRDICNNNIFKYSITSIFHVFAVIRQQKNASKQLWKYDLALLSLLHTKMTF